jgi:glycine cleavage system aminomethyltransferase T
MGDDDAIKTAFHDVTEAQGGTHTADGGWLWLEGFGDLGKEYAAIRDDVAVWDVSPLNKWDLRGPDALRAAQRCSATTRSASTSARLGTGRSWTPTG